MKRFVAGMLTMLLIVVASLLVLFGMAREPGATARQVPMGPGISPSPPPEDLGPQETWLGDVDLTSAALVTPDGPLRDVHATGTNVRVTASGLRVGQVVLDATLPFEVAAQQVGEGVELYDAGSGLAGVRRSARVLGVDLAVRATGRVLAEGGNLVILPERVDVGLPGLVNDALSEAARDLVTIRQSVQGLPRACA